MAQVALGTECPQCKSLTAVSGRYDDEHLNAQCGTCGNSISIPNPQYVTPRVSSNTAEKSEEVFQITNADGSLGVLTVTGYDLNVVATNLTLASATVPNTGLVTVPNQEVTEEAPPEVTSVTTNSTGDEDEPGDDQG